MKNLIPADTVDAAGNVWETVGENIRYGTKDFSKSNIEAIINAIFPVGSIYAGEITVVTSVGKWEPLKDGISMPLILKKSDKTGSITGSTYITKQQETLNPAVSIRLWKRVS